MVSNGTITVRPGQLLKNTLILNVSETSWVMEVIETPVLPYAPKICSEGGVLLFSNTMLSIYCENKFDEQIKKQIKRSFFIWIKDVKS
jgi:hypothetical protein